MSSTAVGHLFVLHGRIGAVVSDADIISTDRAFTVEPPWWPVLGVKDSANDGLERVRRHRPGSWDVDGYGRSSISHRTWFLDVGSASFTSVAARLEQLLNYIAGTELPTSPGRVLPLVTVPLLGVGAGGHGGRRGDVINQQLEVCQRFVAEHSIDVAIVTPTRSAYGALQHQRRAGLAPSQRASPLIAHARQHGLALFIGAGASVPSGLPSWKDLLKGLLALDRRRKSANTLTSEEAKSFKKLDALDQAQLLQQMLGDSLADDVASLIEPGGNQRTPALSHVLLAALECRAAVTTNYDTLYEKAVESTLAPGKGQKVTVVLPEHVPDPGDRWLLKMHGSINRPKTIVLTRSQFAGFDASAGPSGAVLQSLLLTSHLLVVGTSMSDPNVLRLIDGVERYRQAHAGTESGPERHVDRRKLGTVLDVSGEPARRRLHSGSFQWVSLEGSDVKERARDLEILLDEIAMHASEDMTWLLDPRFVDLHGSEALRTAAAQLQAVVRSLPGNGLSPAWTNVRDQLRAWGARTEDGAIGATTARGQEQEILHDQDCDHRSVRDPRIARAP